MVKPPTGAHYINYVTAAVAEDSVLDSDIKLLVIVRVKHRLGTITRHHHHLATVEETGLQLVGSVIGRVMLPPRETVILFIPVISFS